MDVLKGEKKTLTAVEVRDLYVDQGKSKKEISRIAGCSPYRVHVFFSKEDIEVRPDKTRGMNEANASRIQRAKERIAKASPAILQDYTSGLSINAIARKYHVSYDPVRRVLIDNGVSIRTSSQQNQLTRKMKKEKEQMAITSHGKALELIAERKEQKEMKLDNEIEVMRSELVEKEKVIDGVTWEIDSLQATIAQKEQELRDLPATAIFRKKVLRAELELAFAQIEEKAAVKDKHASALRDLDIKIKNAVLQQKVASCAAEARKSLDELATWLNKELKDLQTAIGSSPNISPEDRIAAD